MGAYESLLDRAQKKAVEVTKDAESWKRFLESAAYTYQNSFLNQLLIYDQRPEARAVAPMKYWNDKAHFWVRRGAKGIWVIKYGGAQATARVMFDLSDTSPHGYEATAMQLFVGFVHLQYRGIERESASRVQTRSLGLALKTQSAAGASGPAFAEGTGY